jgi:hypothetical protein
MTPRSNHRDTPKNDRNLDTPDLRINNGLLSATWNQPYGLSIIDLSSSVIRTGSGPAAWIGLGGAFLAASRQQCSNSDQGSVCRREKYDKCRKRQKVEACLPALRAPLRLRDGQWIAGMLVHDPAGAAARTRYKRVVPVSRMFRPAAQRTSPGLNPDAHPALTDKHFHPMPACASLPQMPPVRRYCPLLIRLYEKPRLPDGTSKKSATTLQGCRSDAIWKEFLSLPQWLRLIPGCSRTIVIRQKNDRNFDTSDLNLDGLLSAA